jgi:hypothetical protein
MAPTTTAMLRPLRLFMASALIASADALHDRGVGSSRSAVNLLRGGASASAIEDKAAEARNKCAVAPRLFSVHGPSPAGEPVIPALPYTAPGLTRHAHLQAPAARPSQLPLSNPGASGFQVPLRPCPPRLSSWWASSKPAASLSGTSQDAEFQKALGLMKARGLSNVEKAVSLLRQVHQRDDSVQVRLRARTTIEAHSVDPAPDMHKGRMCGKEMKEASSAYDTGRRVAAQTGRNTEER